MSDLGEPGFRQTELPRQRGLKTGRLAPRQQQRPSAWDKIQNDNGLKTLHPNQVGTHYDPNQGSLFDVTANAPHQVPDAQRARELGAPTGRIAVKGKDSLGLAARPGFMPNLDTHKQKIAAINNVSQARMESGAWRGGGDFAEIMSDRADHAKWGRAAGGHHADWYEGTGKDGKHDGSVGSAPASINNVAAQIGVSSAAVTRGVAFQSPQMGWQDANTGAMPNLAATRGTLEAVQSAKRQNPDIGSEAVHQVGVDNPGLSLPNFSGKTAVNFHEKGDNASAPFPVQGVNSQKAPNFEASLHLSHIDPAVRRIASTAYTVDRHDSAIAGVDADTGLKRRGVYDAVAMTGRRAALKSGQLPPNEQAVEWVGRKATSPDSMVDAPRLFDPTTNRPNPNAVSAPPATRTQQRGGYQSTAEKMGLEF